MVETDAQYALFYEWGFLKVKNSLMYLQESSQIHLLLCNKALLGSYIHTKQQNGFKTWTPLGWSCDADEWISCENSVGWCSLVSIHYKNMFDEAVQGEFTLTWMRVNQPPGRAEV